MIQTVVVSAGPPQLTQALNVGDGEYYGVELGIQSQLTELWSVAATYTHLEREIVDPLQPGIEVTGAPDDAAFVAFSFEPSAKLSITPSVELANDRWSEVTGGGYIRTGDYTLLNLQVEYRGDDFGRSRAAARTYSTRISSSPMAIPSLAAAPICGSGSSFEGRRRDCELAKLRQVALRSQSCRWARTLHPQSHRPREGAPMLQSIADLKRYPVYNQRGDKLGAIDDVILDADGWSICYAVLRYEAKGEPEKLLGVALDALSLDSENECLVVAADDAALRQARGFDRDAPPARPDPLFKSPEK